jgi:prepilin peptidase CpaA
LPLPELTRIVIAVAATAVLAVAAVSDVRHRRIPNWTVLALIALFAMMAIALGGKGLVSALAAAAVAFVVSVGLYALRFVGAGDSKLITAVALFAGLGYLPLLAVGTTLTGGVIAAASFISRPTRAMVMVTLRGKGDWGRGIPYGVAIAVGGLLVIWAPLVTSVQPFPTPFS